MRRELASHDLVGSMGRGASGGDNASTESFFRLSQKNVLNRRLWASRNDLRTAIERAYLGRRRHAR